LKQYNFL